MVLARCDRQLLLAAATGALLLALSASTPARAGDDGEAPLWKGIGGMLGLTSSDKPNDKLNYDERAKLVLPPTTDLPPPGAAPQRTADWPQDPDVLKAQKDRDERLHHVTHSPTLDKASGYGRPISPTLLRSDHAPPGDPRTADPCQRDPRNCHWIGATVLEKLGIKKDPDTLVAGQEPDREWLTDPPQGYRVPSTSVKATFEAPSHVDPADQRTLLYQAPSE
ncbi:MAG TPA: hypothetical protein VKS78_03065 [Roseiarcus sp.]|nr:hypothetical protein [Roseiarcus sp.]